MSVDRRIIGVPASIPKVSAGSTTVSLRNVPSVPTPVPSAPPPESVSTPFVWNRGSATTIRSASSAVALRARYEGLERVRDRVLEAGGESPEIINDYLRRFNGTELPWTHVFGQRPIAEVRATVGFQHPTLHISPSDVAIATLQPSLAIGLVEPSERAQGVGVIAAISDKTSNRACGFYVHTLVNSATQGRFDYLDFAVVNPTAGSALGVGKELTALGDRLADLSGSAQSRLKTAWVGRYYWAQKGYDFASAAERTTVVGCFARFVNYMKLDESKLFIEPPGGPRRPFSWAGLQHSWDIAYVGSTEGPVEVPGLVANDQTKTVSAAVGKAFYLGDWSDPTLGQKGADLFVRNWHGVRQRPMR